MRFFVHSLCVYGLLFIRASAIPKRANKSERGGNHIHTHILLSPLPLLPPAYISKYTPFFTFGCVLFSLLIHLIAAYNANHRQAKRPEHHHPQSSWPAAVLKQVVNRIRFVIVIVSRFIQSRAHLPRMQMAERRKSR